MLDIKFIRENKDLIKMAARKKHLNFDVEKLIEVDEARKAMLVKVEEKRAKQNEVGQKIAQASPEEKQKLLSEMTLVKADLQKEEQELKDIMTDWRKLMLECPNIPDMSVPEGKDDSENIEVRTWGEIPTFDFTPKSHIDLMNDLDLADFERGTKIAGFRGYILKNEGALLQQAVLHYTMQHMASKGFTPMIVPSLVKRETLMGTGYLPQGEEDLYKTQDDEFLAGTGEVSTMSYYSDEVLKKEQLPIKFISFSTCFRREAGSHGKQTKGIYRVHEFYKLEQVVLCEASHEESVKYHEELTRNAEEILQAFKLPHRVVVNCGGDLGLGQVKKYDIEAWIPSENRYGETHSSSYFHDFQTRRLNIKYEDTDGKKKLVHSLNNTAIAVPRVLIQILENNQQSDGSINIPDVLRPYMGGISKIEHKK
jgi:seryl-tRNA synthetase